MSPFNLIFDPRSYDGRVVVLRGSLTRDLAAAPRSTLAVHATGGTVRLSAYSLQPGDTAICDSAPARLELGDGATALLITLAMRDQIEAIRPEIALR